MTYKDRLARLVFILGPGLGGLTMEPLRIELLSGQWWLKGCFSDDDNGGFILPNTESAINAYQALIFAEEVLETVIKEKELKEAELKVRKDLDGMNSFLETLNSYVMKLKKENPSWSTALEFYTDETNVIFYFEGKNIIYEWRESLGPSGLRGDDYKLHRQIFPLSDLYRYYAHD